METSKPELSGLVLAELLYSEEQCSSNIRKSRPCNKYQIYEEKKRQLKRRNLSHSEYERKVKKLAGKLEV